MTNLVSLFCGCGGLDLGFSQAGFNIEWANEYDKTIWETYELNHPHTKLVKGDITKIKSKKIPSCLGIIGGPPCQSWSEAGSAKGLTDPRGQLFMEYIQVIKDKQPLFFVAENVSGFLHKRHAKAFLNILNQFKSLGYTLSFKLVNANDYNVPQDRRRVIIVGYRTELGITFKFPEVDPTKPTLKTAISGLPHPCKYPKKGIISNHEYLAMDFSSRFMSRNRVRKWTEPSFTIPATARHVPLHPSAGIMLKVGTDKFVFAQKSVRRLSVRECARIQTFPDTFAFKYTNISDGYKMVGNAVPVNLAKAIATQIFADLSQLGHC